MCISQVALSAAVTLLVFFIFHHSTLFLQASHFEMETFSECYVCRAGKSNVFSRDLTLYSYLHIPLFSLILNIFYRLTLFLYLATGFLAGRVTSLIRSGGASFWQPSSFLKISLTNRPHRLKYEGSSVTVILPLLVSLRRNC